MENKRAVSQVLPAWAELVRVVRASVKEEMSSPVLAALVSTTAMLVFAAVFSYLEKSGMHSLSVILVLSVGGGLGLGWGRFFVNRLSIRGPAVHAELAPSFSKEAVKR